MFSGQFFDSEIDEYHLRARQYDPYIGRFTSRDPVLGKFEDPLSLHKYLYCQNEPISRFDPFGRDYIDINFTWTYGMTAGMIQGGIMGSGFGPVGTGIGAGVGLVAGGLGATGGLMIERHEAHLYLGPSWTTNPIGGFDVTFSVAPNPDATVDKGWHFGAAGMYSGAYGQWSKNLRTGSTATEVGMTTGGTMAFGGSVSLFYVFSGMQIPYLTGGDPRSAFRDLDLLDRAVMLNEMREDTGALMKSNTLGTIGKIAFLSYYGVTADMLLGM